MPKMLNSSYIISTKLGEGATSEVFLAIEQRTNKHFAVKLLREKKEFAALFNKEFQMIQKMDHPNVINLLEGGKGIIEDTRNNTKFINNYLLFELAENGDLADYLVNNKGFTETQARYIFKEILNGLKACHDNGIAHNDIKLENVMVDSELKFKLADFGFASLLERDVNYTGTPGYQAPEKVEQKPHDGVKSDIFSLGVLLYGMVFAEIPFKGARKFDARYQYFVKRKQNIFWEKSIKINQKSVSPELIDLINSLLDYDPIKRLTIDEIFNHPWINITGQPEASLEDIRKDFQERAKVIIKRKKIKSLLNLNQ